MPNTRLDRLKSQLLTSGMAQKNNALFQVIDQLIGSVQEINNNLENLDITIPDSAGPDFTYITSTDESADLPNSRNLIAGTNITFDDSVANARTVNVAAIPTDIHTQDFITGADDHVALPNSRQLLAGVGITFNDGVANQRTISVASGTGILTGSGNPQGVLSAGIGSMYVDTVTGYFYRKIGGGSTAYGWYVLADHDTVTGPLAFLAIPTVLTSGAPFRDAIGYGALWQTGGTLFSQTLAGASSKLIINSKVWVSGATSGVAASVTHLTTAQASEALLLDDDFDIFVWVNTDPTAITNTRIWFGFTSAAMTDVISAPASASSFSAILIRYLSDGNGVWEGITSTATTRVVSSSLGAVVAATNYKLRIRFVRQGTPTVYYSVNDGTEVSLTTNIPATGTAAFLTLGIDQPAGIVAKAIRWRAFGGTFGS